MSPHVHDHKCNCNPMVYSSIICCMLILAPMVISYRSRVVSFVSSRNISCELTVRYQAADIEQQWYDSINEIADRTAEWKKGCAMLRQQKDRIMQWLDAASERTRWADKADRGRNRSRNVVLSTPFLSYHRYKLDCGNNTFTTTVSIEPIVGFLKHPLYICFQEESEGSPTSQVEYSTNKTYLLPMFDYEYIWERRYRDARTVKRYFFSLGASLFTNGSSLQWFVNTYTAHGLSFDHIFAWESKLYKPEQIFKGMPLEVLSRISFYNINPSVMYRSNYNPLNILKATCHIEDFVVIKIDIDRDIENSILIKQILSDTAISDRIDELYFDHHVTYSPKEHHGWTLNPKRSNITQSYEIFTELRIRGIRAHSWI
jgi:hypothetical protein